ncbi:MAG: YqaJ viral recombinase family protein [Lacisediminihabitans sp.]
MTLQPTLSLWDEPAPDYRTRIVAHSDDRAAWLHARSKGITATDVAKLTSAHSVQVVAIEKLHGSNFGGNAYTDHGLAREPVIALWVKEHYGIDPSTALFHAAGIPAHLATPDGVSAPANGPFELAEIKTTKSAWRSIPRSYLRQIWWQQYVLGADRTLLVWEQHDNFVPVNAEPECRWIERDENEIHRLVGLANRVLEIIASERRH